MLKALNLNFAPICINKKFNIIANTTALATKKSLPTNITFTTLTN